MFPFQRNAWNSAEDSPEAIAALQRKKALWERQKATAMKEHQARLAQLEKVSAAPFLLIYV